VVGLAGALAVALGACGGDPGADVDAAAGGDASSIDADPLTLLEPGPAFELSTGNSAGQDEDPALARGPDGRLWVAWYSNRNGADGSGREDKQIFLRVTGDGTTWAAPIQVSYDPEWAFYPDLAVVADGVHVAWWRNLLLPAGCVPGGAPACVGVDNRLAYAHSPDGLGWPMAAPVDITSGPGDWLPSILIDPATSEIRVYFAAVARAADGSVDLGERRSRLYVVTRAAGAAWSAPVRLLGVDDGASHDSYPDVVRNGDGGYLMTWTRFDGALDGGPLQVIQTDTSETMVATSSDGVTFTGVTAISAAATPATDAFPHLFADHAGGWHVTWITTALGPATQVELAVGADPSARVVRPELAGYTASAIATPTPGVFLGAFVDGANPTQRVMGRLFRRD
jgi:hypothetical protein